MTTSPIKAIREYCLWCCLEQKKEIRMCPAKNCPIWPYRNNKRKVFPKPELKPRKAIKTKCLDCSGYKRIGKIKKRVKNCKFKDCALYIHKSGKRPRRRW